ncbi:MAG: nucleotidyltransferase domain-containing protein [Deltaproteobacteria bacterium]|nr:nucleotidyltransferase domain-containing protein [Deltaproteobacteria bacterium]
MFKRGLKKRSDDAVARFVAQLGDEVRLRCVLVFGSYARGNFTEGSDIDVCVVADGLPADIFARRHLRGRTVIAGMSAMGFTPAEFLELLQAGNFLLLDIMADGVVVFDDGFYQQAREEYAVVVQRRGLVREEKGWRFRVEQPAGAK